MLLFIPILLGLYGTGVGVGIALTLESTSRSQEIRAMRSGGVCLSFVWPLVLCNAMMEGCDGGDYDDDD